MIMFLKEEVEVDAWKEQDDDDDGEMNTRYLVEHVFIAVPIDENREEESDKYNKFVWTPITRTKTEEKEGERKEEEKSEEVFGFGKNPDTYLGEIMRTR